MRRSLVFASLLSVLFFSITQPGCSCGSAVHHGNVDAGGGPGADLGGLPGDDGGGPPDDAGSPTHDDGGYLRSCAADSPDLEGCGCTIGDPPRACWPYTIDPVYRGVGLCADGMQTCVMDMEFAAWSSCDGAWPPMPEYCANMLDDSCDGLTDCADPTCATDPACQSACTDGDTRSCYDGPSGTADVGACHAGTQTCVGGAWSATCDGEVLPAAEDCSAPVDLNCNHLVGCFDLFVCITSPYCMEHCPMPPDPGCVCPDGSGDVATCPRGMATRTTGTIGGTIECCPCTASDCGGGPTGCCQEPVCHGSSYCGGLYCPPLPASCMGRVSADCDDFPEDCDEPCCECYGDCSGA